LVSSDEEEEENSRSRIAAIRAGKRKVSRELNAILDDSDDEMGSFLKGSPSSPKTMASKRVAVSSSENAELKDNIHQSIEASQLTVGMKTVLDQRIQDLRPDPAVIAALEEKIRKLNDANRQLEAEMDRKNQQHSFEIRVKEAVNEAKLKRLEDKLDHANTQIETEKQQVTELKKRLKAAMRPEGILNESLQQLKWKSEGATDGLSQFESGLRQRDNRSQESTALIPSRDVDPAELRRLNEVFLLKQQFSALQGEKQLVVRQRDAFSTQLKASITTNETLRADIYRNETAHGIEIERLQKHFKTLQAEKERLEHRIAEFIATFETFKSTKKVDRETIAAHIQTIENLQKVDRSLLIGEYRKLEEKRDNESFQNLLQPV
jgi:chromosome segregation ATPase